MLNLIGVAGLKYEKVTWVSCRALEISSLIRKGEEY